MTRHTPTIQRAALVWLLVSILLPGMAALSAAPVAAQAGAGNDSGNATGNATGNSTDSGGGGGWFSGWGVDIGPIDDWLRNPGETLAEAIAQVARGVLLAIAYVPAPNNMVNYFLEPTNGIWTDRWGVYQDKARPLFWGLAGLTLGSYAIGAGTGTLPRTLQAGWARRWAVNFLGGLMAWTLAGAWLTARKGLTYWFLQDVTAATLGSTLTSAIVLVAFVVVAFINIWALAVLLLIAGMVFGGTIALTPWLTALIMARALPIRILAAAADRIVKLWFVLTLLTLPIAAFVGMGFSLDVGAAFDPSAVALDNPEAVAGSAAIALLSVAVKFGSILGGIFGAWWIFSGLSSVGMATGVVAAPSPDQVRQQYQRGREQAGRVRERTETVVNAPREVARGARGRQPVNPSTPSSRSYDVGHSVRTYAHAVRPGSSPSSSGAAGATSTTTREAVADQTRSASRSGARSRWEAYSSGTSSDSGTDGS